MANKNLSTRGLTGLLGDIRKNNNFVVHIEDVTNDGNSLELVIRQAFLPQVSLNPIELRRGNDAKMFAGVATWQGGQITIFDTLSRRELDDVLEWFRQTYDAETGQIGIASEYKKQGYITEFAADGRYRRRWKVNGLWISDINLGDLDASSGEMKQITFTLSIDPSPMRPEYSDDNDADYSDN